MPPRKLPPRSPTTPLVRDIEDLIPDARAVQRRVISWYRAQRRDLPWRPAPSSPSKPRTTPYGVWVSEIMSQQTQIATVLKYWDRWMKRFPTPAALAAASDDCVRKEWAGMGFYRRAANLRKGAQFVVDNHGGTVPLTKAELMHVPGIGNYTAGAIASICAGERVAAVDGNVMRVVTRLRGDLNIDVKVPAVAKRIERELERHVLVGCDAPGDFNQGLMEIGASLCRPNGQPLCDACPLRDGGLCGAARLLAEGKIAGIDGVIPLKSQKTKQREEAVATLVIRSSDGRTMLVKRPPEGLLAGMLEFPTVPVADSVPAALASLRTKLGVGKATAVVANGKVEHIFTHIRMTLHVFTVELQKKRFDQLVYSTAVRKAFPTATFLAIDDVKNQAISTAMLKVLERSQSSVVDVDAESDGDTEAALPKSRARRE